MVHRDVVMVGAGVGTTVLVVGAYVVLRLLVRALVARDREPNPWIRDE